MTAQRGIVGAALALVAVSAAFWFGVIAPQRADTARVGDRLAAAQARLSAAQIAAAGAQKARAAYQRDYATVAELGKAVPADDDVASLLFQLEAVAKSSKVDFRSAKLASGSAPAAEAPITTTPKNADAAAKDKTAAAATPVPVVAQAPPGASVGSAGLLTLPFTFTFDGGYLRTQRLLGAIDDLADATGRTISVHGRLLTVDGFSLTASRLGFPKVKAQVSATAYILPPSQGLGLPGTAAAAPATATPAAASSGGSTAPANATATIQGARP